MWPGLRDILKPDSHILQFADLFDVISSEENKTGSDLWRIFNRPYEGSTEGFPADTTLRRGFLKLVNEGNLGGFGYGYIFMKDGQIINRK